MAGTLKYPVLKGCEYLDIIKNKITIQSFKHDELEGLKWRQVQELVGSKVGAGSFRYTIKFKNDDKTSNGTIRSVVSNEILKKESKLDNTELVSLVKTMTNKLDNMTNNAPQDTAILIATIKEGHSNSILMYQERLAEKQRLCDKYEIKIDSLEKELGEQDDIIAELQSKSGNMEYFKALADIVKAKFGGHAQSLADTTNSDESDIPASLLEVLGVVEWSQVPEETVNLILDTLKQFIHKLPLKGQ